MRAICFAFCWQSWCEKQHSLIKQCQKTRIFQSVFQSEVLFFADLAISCKRSMSLWLNDQVWWRISASPDSSCILMGLGQICWALGVIIPARTFQARICACFDWSESAVPKLCGTSCVCCADCLPMHCKPSMYHVCPAYCVHAGKSSTCSAHVRQPWRMSRIYWVRAWHLQAHLFQYIASAVDLLHPLSWLPRDQCSPMMEWSKAAGGWSGIWTSRKVRQTAIVLVFHMDKTSGKIKSRRRRKPGWTVRTWGSRMCCSQELC